MATLYRHSLHVFIADIVQTQFTSFHSRHCTDTVYMFLSTQFNLFKHTLYRLAVYILFKHTLYRLTVYILFKHTLYRLTVYILFKHTLYRLTVYIFLSTHCTDSQFTSFSAHIVQTHSLHLTLEINECKTEFS